MSVYERETSVSAPLSEVWEFHSSVDGLQALTPSWMRLRVESAVGPDGEPAPDVLETGSEVRLSVRPLGIGPRVRWRSRIVDRRFEGDEALFRDEMVDGPFETWVHTHRFVGRRDRTIVSDRVEYELPGGSVGRTTAPVLVVGLEPMFRYRHRRTGELLEG